MSDLIPGVVHAVSPLVRRVVAPNPSLMTGAGTNTYLVGIDEVAVIDPGPDDAGHIDAIVEAAGAARVRWILLTHTHPDHAPASARLRGRTGAPVHAYARRDRVMPADRVVHDDDIIEGAGFTLRALHTPGHAPNHLCFLLRGEQVLFTGDTVLDGTTSVVSPPTGGDMAQYFASLRRLRRLGAGRIAPGHGHMIEDPRERIDGYLRHRTARERQILRRVRRAPARIPEIVASLYTETPEGLLDMAGNQVYAHLRKLRAEGRVAGRSRRSVWTAA